MSVPTTLKDISPKEGSKDVCIHFNMQADPEKREDLTIHILSSVISVDSSDDEIRCMVGEEKRILIGQKSKMAAISPVFDAMLRGEWEASDDIYIPDVHPHAFVILLRYADTKAFPRVTESTVWDVLKAADKYQVLPLVLHCFHFLLHKHRRRGRGEHLCAVLEMAHHLHYEKQYKQCLRKVQRKAGTILKSSSTSSSLSQFCHACFLDVIRGDYLGGIEEAIVHDAVMTWTRRACAGRGGGTSEPSWDELRATAGQLVYHVRYLAMPRPTLMRLLEGHPFSCLLTRDEMDNLLNHGGSLFPPTVRWPRKEKPSRGKRRVGVAGLICRFVVVLVVVQLVFLVQFLVVKSVICPLAQPRETTADSGSYLNATVCD